MTGIGIIKGIPIFNNNYVHVHVLPNSMLAVDNSAHDNSIVWGRTNNVGQ